MWFRTNFGSRVALDVDPVDDDNQLARYWINYDAASAIAVSWAKLRFLPEAVGKPKYSTHFDTCERKRNRQAAAR